MTSTKIGNFGNISSYSEEQVESVLDEIGLTIVSETENVFSILCPFHRNTDSASFAVNKESGLYICFSPACDVRGNLVELVQQMTRKNVYESKRLISRYQGSSKSLKEQLDDITRSKETKLPEFSTGLVNGMSDALWNSPAHAYMNGRGFTDQTLAYFQIGYSHKKNLVVIPIHDWDANLVGVIGRSLKEKRFENSEKLPTSKILFNLHRAKTIGETVIIVESAMDAMRIYQAGFPNVVSTNGGFFTKMHTYLINKYFNRIVIMTDYDDPQDYINENCTKCKTCYGHSPGRILGRKIANALPNKIIRWASYDWNQVYPHGAKDAGDMTIEEIQQCIGNAVNDIDYLFWKRELPYLALQ